MGAESQAKALGIEFTDDAKKGYLNMVARVGHTLITSGHVSDIKGKLGDDLTVDEGYAAARECGIAILQSVHQEVGSLDGIKVVKLLGMVNSSLDFTDQHLVVNGISDLFHEIFGKDGDGFHARSAVGFAQLPTGVAVEVEAIFEVA
jgi:enamine deaminase RidA (YjgF/YER057c/UK114 family)